MAAGRSKGVEASLNQIATGIHTAAGSLIGVGTIAIIHFATGLCLQVNHHKVLTTVATGKQMYLLLALGQTDAELHAAIGQCGHFHYTGGYRRRR